MSEENTVLLWCPKDGGGLKIITIRADQHSALAKCKLCGTPFEVTTTSPPVSIEMTELKGDTE